MGTRPMSLLASLDFMNSCWGETENSDKFEQLTNPFLGFAYMALEKTKYFFIYLFDLQASRSNVVKRVFHGARV